MYTTAKRDLIAKKNLLLLYRKRCTKFTADSTSDLVLPLTPLCLTCIILYIDIMIHVCFRCFTFGIGSGASTSLVEGLAKAGNGSSEFVKEGERMQPKVCNLRMLAFNEHGGKGLECVIFLFVIVSD